MQEEVGVASKPISSVHARRLLDDRPFDRAEDRAALLRVASSAVLCFGVCVSPEVFRKATHARLSRNGLEQRGA